jgi:hypothetical protein
LYVYELKHCIHKEFSCSVRAWLTDDLLIPGNRLRGWRPDFGRELNWRRARIAGELGVFEQPRSNRLGNGPGCSFRRFNRNRATRLNTGQVADRAYLTGVLLGVRMSGSQRDYRHRCAGDNCRQREHGAPLPPRNSLKQHLYLIIPYGARSLNGTQVRWERLHISKRGGTCFSYTTFSYTTVLRPVPSCMLERIPCSRGEEFTVDLWRLDAAFLYSQPSLGIAPRG